MSSDIKQKIVDRVMGKKSAPSADELAVRFGNEMLENLRRNVTAQKEQDAFEIGGTIENNTVYFVGEHVDGCFVPKAVAEGLAEARKAVSKCDPHLVEVIDAYYYAQIPAQSLSRQDGASAIEFQVDVTDRLNAELDTVLGADVRVLHHTPNHDDFMKADWEPTDGAAINEFFSGWQGMPLILHPDQVDPLNRVCELLLANEKETTSHTPLPQDEAKAGAKKYLQSVQPNTRPTLDDLRTENGETEHLHTVQPVFASLPPEQVEMLEAFEYGVSTKLLRRLKEIEHRVEILVTGKVAQ